MKLLRSEVANSEKLHYKQIRTSTDFYSLSSLRDLLFHVHERQFDIPQIKDCLSELVLNLRGFEADRIVLDFNLTNTGINDPYDPDKWNSYKKSNPRSFPGIYQFWCQRIL